MTSPCTPLPGFIYVTVFTRLCPNAIRFANLPWAEKMKDRAGQMDLVKQARSLGAAKTPF